MNNIPFLSLKDVTALHGAEINEAVARVINNGISKARRSSCLRSIIPSLSVVNILSVVPTVWMHSSGSSVHTSRWG